MAHMTEMRLLLEEQEHRRRSNYLRIKGLPELATSENLMQTLQDFLAEMMMGEDGACTVFKLDGAYRLACPHSPDPSLPRDVVVQLHYFSDREILIQKAWAHGPFEYRGGTVTILSDLLVPGYTAKTGHP